MQDGLGEAFFTESGWDGGGRRKRSGAYSYLHFDGYFYFYFYLIERVWERNVTTVGVKKSRVAQSASEDRRDPRSYRRRSSYPHSLTLDRLDTMPHNHSAHCSDDAHDDDHDHDHESETGPADNLYPYIDIQHVVALNASDETSPSSVIKPWDKRLDESTVLSLHLLLSLPSISLLLLSCRLVCRERCGRPAVRLLFLFPFKGANVFFIESSGFRSQAP